MITQQQLSDEGDHVNFFETFLALIIATALSGIAHSQIYQSKDAEGNPVFSDAPIAGADLAIGAGVCLWEARNYGLLAHTSIVVAGTLLSLRTAAIDGGITGIRTGCSCWSPGSAQSIAATA